MTCFSIFYVYTSAYMYYLIVINLRRCDFKENVVLFNNLGVTQEIKWTKIDDPEENGYT